jgi:hypothetical protein
MRTNTSRQQATRHMSKADKAAMMASAIAADTQARREHERLYRATVALWQHADTAGLTPAERHALDMALMRGGDPEYLSTTF